MDAAVNHLRADGLDVRDEDLARLSPFERHLVNMGRYSFQLPDLPGGLRPLLPGRRRRGVNDTVRVSPMTAAMPASNVVAFRWGSRNPVTPGAR
ncbi:hypothetical protein QQY66_47425 [Streptomyces sp. DG2A-72]|nr:hypothetical protein [Streptomyces sp. DG2A-72]MDO0938981.1 hypothetical protein [Streptomyces sp. DG2A-72]